MTLDSRLVTEACQELWDECHERIEALGYTLGKDSMMHGPKEISIIAAIQPEYSPEMVDVFRRSDAIASITEEALSVSKEKGIRSIWMQLGVIDETSANKANSAGLTVIMDRCLKIEYAKF